MKQELNFTSIYVKFVLQSYLAYTGKMNMHFMETFRVRNFLSVSP
jgi:hypothetical protein